MRSRILKPKILVLVYIITLVIFSCNRKNDLENQITIKINSIDRKTKLPRTNVFDTIEVRIESIGFPAKRFPKIAEYVTDSSGSVKIKIDRDEKYLLLLSVPYFYGSEDIVGKNLKDGQEINMEVFHPE
ncbi:hypothetical protein EZL74_12450 [Flavobacterium silvisoli]|uniref:Uncharacterized protein n=1 Tax=Flavobacterium silvisoli TaxID=2529433 RepID=A0A4Q9YP86_9FLAO|nr:hypothetical protein [Flavobacterium silvisoli]TBX65196.1 hypothetical protein EZL74_12450 [Flavobacterium silvisoli]